jgi:riboflavin kinase/FMN adenylyltransferase
MNTVTSLKEAPEGPLVLAAGAFDGLHRGHMAVIQTAKTLSESHKAELGVLRFHPHPAKILRPQTAPLLLSTETYLAGRLGEQGVALQIRLPFSASFAQREPEEFLEDLHTHLPGLSGMVVGSNWRFGHRGRGDLRLLQDWGSRHKLTILQTENTLHDGEMISSTRIRHAVLDGDLQTAATLLGRPYAVSGSVRKGKQFGRDLGFPTANFQPEQECLPPEGVYAMTVHLEGHPPRIGAGYITQDPDLVEVHVLDFKGDLYGQPVSVDLMEFRRTATPIADRNLLQDTIRNDVEGIRADYLP